MVFIVTSSKSLDLYNQKLTHNEEKKNLHNSLRIFLSILQIFGLLPLDNIQKSCLDVSFKWKSYKVVYSLIMLVLTCFAIFTCFYAWADYGYVFADLATYAYYTSSAVTIILYLRLAMRWPLLIKSWCQMDKIMNKSYGYPPSLDKRLKTCSIIFLGLAIVDYFLSYYNRYDSVQHKYGDSYEYKKFFKDFFPQLYLVIPINIFTALYCVLLSFHATLIQVFNDLFIILLSITLALRFKQITEKLEENFAKFPVRLQEFWIELRQDYDRLSILCKQLDDNISYIVLLSYTTNLFFLLVQLYQSLESVAGAIGKVYFIYSFVHLIFRIVCVSLYAAWINDESMEPANILNSVSSSCYNIEVRRLLMQIGFDNVALTGCRMFKITRGIILSIAGAVVTYELVLIQFNSATDEKL